MKKLTTKNIHDIGLALNGLLLGLFLAFMGYMYVSFSAPLIGDVKPLEGGTLLIDFSRAGYERAALRLETRRALPDHDAKLRNPFGIDSSLGVHISQ